MLKLCAAIYEDGYAVYTDGDRTFMLRPPYTLKERVEVREEVLGRAIAVHGFLPTNEAFASLPELLAHLDAKWHELNPPRSVEEMDAGARAVLLQASTRSLERFLNDTEREMTKEQIWEESQRVLLILLENKNLQQNPDLNAKCRRLMKECNDALSYSRSKRAETICELQNDSRLADAMAEAQRIKRPLSRVPMGSNDSTRGVAA